MREFYTAMYGFSLEQLDTFSQVAELGSFSAAAAARNITQPAVSLQVRALERRLGVRLIERTGKRARPTPAGRDLLVHVRRIRDELDHAAETISGYREGSRGTVRIGTGATACIYLLPPVLRRLRMQMPQLEIVVRTGNTGDMLRLLEENVIDAALVTLPAAGRAFAVATVLEDELVALFPDATDADTPVTPALLAARPLLLYEAGGNTRRQVDAWFARAGLVPKPIMELGSVEAIKELVGARLGCAVLPAMAVARPESLGESAVRPLEPRLGRSLGLVMRRDKQLTRGLRALEEALRDPQAS